MTLKDKHNAQVAGRHFSGFPFFRLCMAFAVLLALCGATDTDSARDTVVSYCQLDYDGARTGAHPSLNAQYVKLITWEAEPGWDSTAIVTSFKVGKATVTKSRAAVTVSYQIIAISDGHFIGERDAREESVTYNLVRKGDFWKMALPYVKPHISAVEFEIILKGWLKEPSITNDEKERLKEDLSYLARFAYK